MSIHCRISRHVLILILAALVAITLSYIILVDSQKSRTVSRNPVNSQYFTKQQQAVFDATHNSTDPWKCTCYGYDASGSLSQVVEVLDPSLQEEQQEEQDTAVVPEEPPQEEPPQQKVEEDPVVVPEAFPPPDPELMAKINANLLGNQVLIVATTNYGMRNHLYNWIESLKRTNETKFLIFCLDDKLYAHLIAAGYGDHATLIPEDWISAPIVDGFEEYRSPQYRIITHAKTLIVQRLLYMDINVFFTDVDIVWLRPRMVEYVKALLDVRHDTHVVFQQEGLDLREANSGFYLMRPSQDMKRLLAETIYLQDTSKDLTQQGAMNKALNRIITDIRSSRVVLLDVLYFPNGDSYFNNHLSESRGVDPYILHANYRVGQDKEKELQKLGLWYLNEKWLKQIDKKVEAAMKGSR